MNEFLFFLHLGVILSLTTLALRFGKQALSLLITLQALYANVFVLKQVHLFGLHATTCEVYSVGIMFGISLMQQCYGVASARQTALLSLLCISGASAMSMLHLAYVPSPDDLHTPAYLSIFLPAPRILFASCVSFFTVQNIDISLNDYIRRKYPQFPIGLRIGGILAFCQGLDSILFSFIGLYGVVPNIVSLTFVAYLIKLLACCCAAPLTRTVLHFSPTNNPKRYD